MWAGSAADAVIGAVNVDIDEAMIDLRLAVSGRAGQAFAKGQSVHA